MTRYTDYTLDHSAARAVRALGERKLAQSGGRRKLKIGLASLFGAAVIGVFAAEVVLPWAIGHRWWGLRVEWGPASGYVAASLTLLAVIVALLGNRRSQKLSREALSQSRASYELSERALEESQAKSISDRVYAHRRENVKAVADMWSALDTFDSAVDDYRGARRTAQQSGSGGRTLKQDAAEQTLPALRSVLVDASAKADAALMYARIITDNGPVLDHVNEADGAFRVLSHEVFHTPENHSTSGVEAVRTWVQALEGHRQALFTLRKKSIDILRARLPLHDQAEQDAKAKRKRDASSRALARAVNEHEPKDSILSLIEKSHRYTDEELAKDGLSRTD